MRLTKRGYELNTPMSFKIFKNSEGIRFIHEFALSNPGHKYLGEIAMEIYDSFYAGDTK